MKVRTSVIVLAALMLAGTTAAQSIGGGSGGRNSRTKLIVGADAPKLSIQEWVKGEKVAEFAEDHVYVVEFWATWCAPCIKNIPHLTELQEQYKGDVTFIGVSNEELDTVKPFVTRWGSKMGYTVAVDQRNRTWRSWMDAAGQDGIPHAFIVAKKKIAYMGHPGSTEFEKTLAEVAGGRYDPELRKTAEPFLDHAEYARKMQDWRVCNIYLEQVIELNPYIFNDVAIKKFRIWILDKQDLDGAIAYATGQFVQTYRDDQETLAKLAEMILTDAEVLKQDPERLKKLALRLAEKAASGKGDSDPDLLRVKALALYQSGQRDEAIRVQERAYFIADPEDKSMLKRTLDAYRAGAIMRRG